MYWCIHNLKTLGVDIIIHYTDIDECANDSEVCGDITTASCKNTAGSYSCACRDGFEGSPPSCGDIDECAEAALNDCDVIARATCTNAVPGFTCACNAGYAGNGSVCTGK